MTFSLVLKLAFNGILQLPLLLQDSFLTILHRLTVEIFPPQSGLPTKLCESGEVGKEVGGENTHISNDSSLWGKQLN